MKFKAIIILVLIVVSLIPLYALYQYLQRAMRPKESMKRFIAWLLLMFFIIFAYTFLIVLGIKMLFPGA